MHYWCDFSPVRIQALTGSHPYNSFSMVSDGCEVIQSLALPPVNWNRYTTENVLNKRDIRGTGWSEITPNVIYVWSYTGEPLMKDHLHGQPTLVLDHMLWNSLLLNSKLIPTSVDHSSTALALCFWPSRYLSVLPVADVCNAGARAGVQPEQEFTSSLPISIDYLPPLPFLFVVVVVVSCD